MSPFPIPCINRTSSNSTLTRYGHQGVDVARLKEPGLIEGADDGLTPQGSSKAQVAQSERGEDDWVRDINTLLRFNASFSGRGLLGGGGEEEHEDKSKH
jgi:NADH kinase